MPVIPEYGFLGIIGGFLALIILPELHLSRDRIPVNLKIAPVEVHGIPGLVIYKFTLSFWCI